MTSGNDDGDINNDNNNIINNITFACDICNFVIIYGM